MSTAIPGANVLGKRVLFGASWSAIARVTIQLSALAASTVVARRVPPNAFGIVGMATLAIGLISLFRDLGTAAAVIQKRDLNHQLLSSLFWVNVGIGLENRSDHERGRKLVIPSLGLDPYSLLGPVSRGCFNRICRGSRRHDPEDRGRGERGGRNRRR